MEENGEGFVSFFLSHEGIGISGVVGGRHLCHRQRWEKLENNNQHEKVGGDPEMRKRCSRRGGNTMMPMTTTMKRQSMSNYQVAEDEKQCNSTVDDNGGCIERTTEEEQRLCGSGRAYFGRGDGDARNAKSVSADKQ
jgi:hypothetical protein